jgi:hypothetical protein
MIFVPPTSINLYLLRYSIIAQCYICIWALWNSVLPIILIKSLAPIFVLCFWQYRYGPGCTTVRFSCCWYLLSCILSYIIYMIWFNLLSIKGTWISMTTIWKCRLCLSMTITIKTNNQNCHFNKIWYQLVIAIWKI